MQAFDDDDDFGENASEDEQNEDEVEQEENEDEDEVVEDQEEEAEDEAGDDDENEETPDAPKRTAPTGPAPSSLGETPDLAPPGEPKVISDATAVVEEVKTPLFPTLRPEALTATDYDIVPTIAAPQSTSINVVAATPDSRWVITGGSDGYIRKYDWIGTANNKLALTVAQRQPLVETISKAGILLSYWENEDPGIKNSELGGNLSPVYSLAVHSRGLWLLSGCESGAISLQSLRHDEGKTQHRLKGHGSAVSVLKLAQDEISLLSGSWDKLVKDWDLNTGQVRRKFDMSSSQISSLEMRPLSSLPVPQTVDIPVPSTTMASDSADATKTRGTDLNGRDPTPNGVNGDTTTVAQSPADSLFGGQDNDSLFGGDDTSAPLFGEDDDFSRAIATEITADNNAEPEPATAMPDEDAAPAQINDAQTEAKTEDEKIADMQFETNGLPQAEDVEMKDADIAAVAEDQPLEDTIFLTSSIDGSLRVWDKRKPEAIAKIAPKNVPPWCMGACWSPDGNFIYAGRRNGTVEEYSLHKGLRGVERSFKFPTGSGPVSAVRALPNGRHLVCASYDTLRLYDLQQTATTSKPPFLVVPGHRTGVISQLYIDPACRFMISAAGNRGWEGQSTQLLLGYEINI